MDDWDREYAERIDRRTRARRLRSLMFVVIVISGLGAIVVAFWLVVNQLWTPPLR